MKKFDKKLDLLWSEIVKLRAGNKCEYCGRRTRLNSHHIFSRSNRCVRWDVENGICLCVSHHVFGNMSAHKAPLEFAEWLKEVRGKKWYNRLRKKASQICKFTIKDKQQIKEELKNKLKNL